MSDRRKTLGVIFLVTGLAGAIIPAFEPRPTKASLRDSAVTLTQAPYVAKPGKGPSCGLLPTDLFTLRLASICGWSCKLPDEIAALTSGQELRVLRDGTRVWQVTVDEEIVYSYEQAVETLNQQLLHGALIFGSLAMVGLGMLAFSRPILQTNTSDYAPNVVPRRPGQRKPP